jgi:hypothetical protein
MSNDILLQSDWYQNPKIKKLNMMIGPQSIVSLLTLWAWAGKNKPNGILIEMDETDISLVSNWTGEVNDFMESLIKVNLITKIEDCYVLQDWGGVWPENKEISKAQNNRPPLYVWKKIRIKVFSRDKYTCQYCGASDVPLECDHIVPVCKNGSHDIDNLITACRPCNQSKGKKLIEEWLP